MIRNWLVCFPLEEVALLALVLGTGEELAAVVGCHASDLPEDSVAAVAAPGVIQVGPRKVLARFTPSHNNKYSFNILCLNPVSVGYRRHYITAKQTF